MINDGFRKHSSWNVCRFSFGTREEKKQPIKHWEKNWHRQSFDSKRVNRMASIYCHVKWHWIWQMHRRWRFQDGLFKLDKSFVYWKQMNQITSIIHIVFAWMNSFEHSNISVYKHRNTFNDSRKGSPAS